MTQTPEILKMSRFAADDALNQLNNRPALLQPAFVAGGPGEQSLLLSSIRRLAEADAESEVSSWDARKAHIVAAFGMPGNQMEQKPFAFANGFAIIPITGLLINRFPYSWGFVTGYNFIVSQVRAAAADDDVTAIIFDVNSGGGGCAGCMEAAEEIFQARSAKPSVALVDAFGYSAAYWLASAATKVVVTPSGGVGSIGVVAGRMDYTKMLSDMGIEGNWVIAGANKLDSNPMTKFSDSARARLQASVDSAYADFTQAVARNRGMTIESVVATEASCYDAADALKIGLVDSVAAPIALIESLDTYLNPPDDEPDPDEDDPEMSQQRTDGTMTTQTTAAAPSADEIAANARTAERARISGIVGCEEAKGKQKLALHLAHNTGTSVEDARATLAAAAPEVAPVAGTQETNHFATAMEGTRQPNVSGGNSGMHGTIDNAAVGGTADTPEAKAAGILSAHRRATGIVPPKAA